MRNCHQILFTAWLAAALVASAGADDATKTRRAELLSQMRELAEQTEVTFADGGDSPQLNPNPVFRYDDQPRRFIDATMWVWTDQGRPVAFQKIEAVEYNDSIRPPSLWQTCFTSTSPELLVVQWPQRPPFRTKESGIKFAPLTAAPAVAEGNLQRKRQARDLARKFSGRILTDLTADLAQQMRLLTTPIFEYADPQTKKFCGSVFGLSTNGTNPDALIVLEVRGDRERPAWHFAVARMTCCGVEVAIGDAAVWQVDWVNGTESPFPTWTFFSSPRRPLSKEDAP